MKCELNMTGFRLTAESSLEADLLRLIENRPGRLYRSRTSGSEKDDIECVFRLATDTSHSMIPLDLVEKHKAYAAGMTYFGHPVESLNSNELLAALGACQQQEKARQNRERQNEQMEEIFEAYRSK